MKKELEKLLNELEEGAKEYIDHGNSHEKGRGHGMQEVITAVREVLDRYMDPEDVQQLFQEPELALRNHYRCPECDTEWEDIHSCACDDRCPKCNVPVTPYDSEDIQGGCYETPE